jgi:ketosteroid isomerase-like protein
MGRTVGAFNAFMRGDLTTADYAESFDPEIEVLWRDRRTYPDFPQRLRGRPELMAFSEQYRGEWAGDFELVPPSQAPLSKPLRGTDEVRAWAADQRDTVGDLSIEIEELIESGESIVALIRLGIRPQGAEADFELRIAHLWRLRDRKLIRCEVFPEREKALEAAGLKE